MQPKREAIAMPTNKRIAMILPAGMIKKGPLEGIGGISPLMAWK
jgi:hypothetical protein